MKTLALFNIKGGVGKTAAAVNLAYLAALEGWRTLLCDLDPQSSSTFYFRVSPKVKQGTKLFLKAGKRLERGIRGSDFENLDLIPADFSFRNLDLDLESAKRRKKQLSRTLAVLADDYDLVFLDCPPNLTLLTENVFRAANFILTPTVPTILSLRTHEQLLGFFAAEEMDSSRILPFFSMVEARKKMHSECIQSLRNAQPAPLESQIPYLADVEKMGIHREPLIKTRPRCAASRAYRALWLEIKKKIGLRARP